MFPVTKLATPATQRSNVNRQTLLETRFAVPKVPKLENIAAPLPIVSSNLHSPATMTIINSNITSIKKAEDQRQSTFSSTWYNIYDSNFHATEETIKVEHVHQCSDEAFGESVNNTCNRNIRVTELYETKAEVKVEFNNKKELSYIEVDVSDEKHRVKSEPVENDDERKTVDYRHFANFKEKTESSGVLGCEKNQIGESSGVCENWQWRNRSPTLLRNQWNNMLPQCKGRNVPIENIMFSKYNTYDSCKQLSASVSSTKDNENGYLTPVKNRIVFLEDNILKTLTNSPDVTEVLKYKNTATDNSYVSDPCNISQTISARISDTSNFNGNYLIPSNAKSIKEFFICDICDKPFRRKSTLVRHILKHSMAYNCTYCSYKTNRKFDLNRHINYKHTKSTIFKCSWCSYKTYDKCHLSEHTNAKHTKNVVFSCSYCNYKTHYKNALNGHVNYKHKKSVVFNCSYCNFIAYRKSNLIQHINCQHTKTTVFNCSYCSFKAYHRSNLLRHINSQHTKATSFNCSFCNYQSFYKSTFNRHVKVKHTNSTVFKCTDCNYRTFYKHDLSKHVKVKHMESI